MSKAASVLFGTQQCRARLWKLQFFWANRPTIQCQTCQRLLAQSRQRIPCLRFQAVGGFPLLPLNHLSTALLHALSPALSKAPLYTFHFSRTPSIMFETLPMDLKNENVRIVQSCRVCEYLQTPVVVNVASDPEPALHEHIAQALLKSVRVKDAVTTTCQAPSRASSIGRSRRLCRRSQREVTWPVARLGCPASSLRAHCVCRVCRRGLSPV